MADDNEKNKGGRPLTFNTPEELQAKVDEYFESIKATDERSHQPPTITGMCLFLGFESRQSFHDYAKREEFSYTIKTARLRVESEYEKRLYSQSPTGAIFALKNLGWIDRHELQHDIPTGFLNIDPLADDPEDNSAQKDSSA